MPTSRKRRSRPPEFQPATVQRCTVSPARRTTQSRVWWAALLTVACLACGAYANSLSNGFVWDDRIILSRQLVVFDSVSAVLVTPRNIPQYSPDYYRPLTVSSLLLDHAIGGENPLPFHLSVVAAHAVVSLLVFVLGSTLFSSPSGLVAATVAAALFAVHPVHTESVAWIAGRSDVLATLFVLAALVAHLRLSPTSQRSIAVGVLTLLALGAKETAIAVIPLLVLSDLCLRRDAQDARGKVWWAGYIGVAVATLVYLVLRRIAVGSLVGERVAGNPVERSVGDLFAAIGVYFAKLVRPVHLNAYIDDVSLDVPGSIATMAAIAGLCALAVYAWRAGRPTITFLVVWLGLTLAPSLAIVWRIPEAPMAERYLYLPSVAFCLLAGAGVMLVWERTPTRATRSLLLGVVCTILAVAVALTWARNRVWSDDLSLWTDTAEKSRIAGLPMRSLGVAHLNRGNADQARRALEEALRRRNGPGGLQVIHNNLGTLAMQQQRYEEARQHYEAALQAYAGAADTLFNLGLAILQQGGASREAATVAQEYFQRAEQLSPHDADIQAALGQVTAIRGDNARALEYLRRALELRPAPAVEKNIRAFMEKIERAPQGTPTQSVP